MADGLKPYMAYSRRAGPEDGAALVVAHTVKEARRIAWPLLWLDEWIDMATREMMASIMALAEPDKLAQGEPHVIIEPIFCQACGVWGAGLTVDGLCGNCNEPPGEELLRRYGRVVE